MQETNARSPHTTLVCTIHSVFLYNSCPTNANSRCFVRWTCEYIYVYYKQWTYALCIYIAFATAAPHQKSLVLLLLLFCKIIHYTLCSEEELYNAAFCAVAVGYSIYYILL